MAKIVWSIAEEGDELGLVVITPAEYTLAYAGTRDAPEQIDITEPVSRAEFDRITMVSKAEECPDLIYVERDVDGYECHFEGHVGKPEPRVLKRQAYDIFGCRDARYENPQDFLYDESAEVTWRETGSQTGVGVIEILPSEFMAIFKCDSTEGQWGGRDCYEYGPFPHRTGDEISLARFESDFSAVKDVLCEGEVDSRQVNAFECTTSDGRTMGPWVSSDYRVVWTEGASGLHVGQVEIQKYDHAEGDYVESEEFVRAFIGLEDDAEEIHDLNDVDYTTFEQIFGVAKVDICDPLTKTRTDVEAFGCQEIAGGALGESAGNTSITWHQTGVDFNNGDIEIGVVETEGGAYPLAFTGTSENPTPVDLSQPITEAVFDTITMVAADLECESEPEVLSRTLPTYWCYQHIFHNPRMFAVDYRREDTQIDWTALPNDPNMGRVFMHYIPGEGHARPHVLLQGTDPDYAAPMFDVNGAGNHPISRDDFLNTAGMMVRHGYCPTPSARPLTLRFRVQEGSTTIRFHHSGATRIEIGNTGFDNPPSPFEYTVGLGQQGVKIYGSVAVWDITDTWGYLEEIVAFGQATMVGLSGSAGAPAQTNFTKVPNNLSPLITDLSYMFCKASNFNQDISGWDTSNVTDMTYAFAYAFTFNQDLSEWCVSNVPNPPVGFDAFVIGWSQPRPVWGTCP